MSKVTMLRAEYGTQAAELIDHATDYGSIRSFFGDAVIETPLGGEVVALTAASELPQIICTWRNLAFVGGVMLVTARTASGYRSLTAEEINQFTNELGGF